MFTTTTRIKKHVGNKRNPRYITKNSETTERGTTQVLHDVVRLKTEKGEVLQTPAFKKNKPLVNKDYDANFAELQILPTEGIDRNSR